MGTLGVGVARLDVRRLGDGGGALGHQGIGLRHRFGQLRVVHHRRHLVLPEVHVTACKLLQIGRVGHADTICQQPHLDQQAEAPTILPFVL